MKAVAKLFKNLFSKKVEIEAVSMQDLVEKLRWAEVEVSDTKDALLGLQFRLQNGINTMDDIIEDATVVISHHQDILNKANARKNEFHGHVSQVTQAVNMIDNIYKN
ncbi:hypothetical protein [Brevibacillus laterosporus]|uniref:hypothetical protein n=1 Tax=Brevibacillus laterosporus TaxID=1465 RepID=UPI003D1B3C57